MANAPPVIRPKLVAWMAARGLSRSEFGQAIGEKEQRVRRWCLAFDDAERRRPDEAALEKIVAYTGGEITAGDFYPPHLADPGRELEPLAGTS